MLLVASFNETRACVLDRTGLYQTLDISGGKAEGEIQY